MSNPAVVFAKSSARRLLSAAAPEWTAAVLSARARLRSHDVFVSWGCRTINQKLIERFGPIVQEGPFAGLVLSPMTHAEHLGPFLLGVYESEIDEAWDLIWAGAFHQILDVGAKFGYYAIGLAQRFRDAVIFAFDTDWWARAAMHEMAAANAVSNLRVERFCSSRWLNTHVEPGALIVCDCEGYEAQLFADPVPPCMHTATLLIETHDCFVEGVTARLEGTFAKTHLVHTFRSSERRRTTSRTLDFLSDTEQQLAGTEIRPEQAWLLCVPRTGPNKALCERARMLASARGMGLRS